MKVLSVSDKILDLAFSHPKVVKRLLAPPLQNKQVVGWLDVPHRLQSVCDLLWRLPKDEVPFAGVVKIVSPPIWTVCKFRLTHLTYSSWTVKSLKISNDR